MLDRRQLLAATPSLLIPVSLDATHAVHELRRLRPLVIAALCAIGDSEGTPGHAAAVTRSEALDASFEALTRRIWATPADSWADIVARAEISLAWACRRSDGTLWGLTSECPEERAEAHLLDAVARVAGCDLRPCTMP